MKVLFDMVHPADVHFFKQTITLLRNRGDTVLITSRQKDITLELLDALGLENICISHKGMGAVGLFIELLQRDVELWKIARQFEPDIFIANNSPCGTHIAWLRGRPSLVFDDTEIHRFNRYLYSPLVTEVHSPQCYRLKSGSKRRYYPGYHALAYLHPNHFQPDPDVLRQVGLTPEEPMALVRFVEWGAMHDIGLKTLSSSDKFRIVEMISAHMKVFISSEAELPRELEIYRLHIPIEQMHHILYYARMVVGESASMGAEAAVLGTPAVYYDELGRGYTDELQNKYGLCFHYRTDDVEGFMNKILELVEIGDTRTYFEEAQIRLLRENIDVAAYQIQQIDRLMAENS